MKKIKLGLWIALLGCSIQISAQQFVLDAELRPRFEYRNGFKTLASDAVDAASFVSQRTRLNFGYTGKEINAYISAQNVRIWGDVPTLASSDSNGIALHQAWAEAVLDEQWTLKLGRQEIVYDDHRIFGNVGWAQQARSHDALLVKYHVGEKDRIDLGLALNANSETLFDVDYAVNNYKAFQFLRYGTALKNAKLSFLVLNNGLAFDDNGEQKTAYNQTFGAHGNFSKNRWTKNVSVYLQTGKIAETKLSAYNFALNLGYKLSDELIVGLGGEYLSGTDMDETDGKLHSFTPWFGTNHKFNGFMDYFYVGNHSNSVGLLDINANLKHKSGKFSMALMPHIFNSAANIIDGAGASADNYLGTEIDFTIGYKLSKNIMFNAGYSQLFASDSMEILKGGDSDHGQNWGWAMLTFKPKFFSTTLE